MSGCGGHGHDKRIVEDLPKLTAHEVADAVRHCFESTYNVNKIVIQKNAK